MSRRRVVITGIGIVSPLGETREATWSALCRGESAVQPIRIQAPKQSLECLGAPVRLRTPARSNATVPCLEEAVSALSAGSADRSLRHYDIADRLGRLEPIADDADLLERLAETAAQEALVHAGLEEAVQQPVERDRFGCCISNSKGNLASFADAWLAFQRDQPMDADHWMDFFPGTLAAKLAAKFGVTGPTSNPIAACATGAHCVVRGAHWIVDGVCDVVLAGCADASLNALVVGSYQRMGVLAQDLFPSAGQAVRPFSRDRTGFAIGEGAAVLVLEAFEHAKARGQEAIAELAGWRLASDAFSITDLSGEADSLAECIRLALKHADASPEHVGHVNCHGTATKTNDVWESAALRKVFGGRQGLKCTANKSMLGHLLGASGGVELAITALALRDRFVPPTINLDEPDPECDLDFTPHHGVRHAFDVAVKTSLGFGGHLAAVVLRKPS